MEGPRNMSTSMKNHPSLSFGVFKLTGVREILKISLNNQANPKFLVGNYHN